MECAGFSPINLILDSHKLEIEQGVYDIRVLQADIMKVLNHETKIVCTCGQISVCMQMSCGNIHMRN